MAITIDKSTRIPNSKANKLFFFTQISLRFLAAILVLVAACIVFTSKQSNVVYGIQVDARYTYSPTFKFFAYANVIACVFSLLSLSLAIVFGRKAADPRYYFYMFLHDLVITLLLMAGCAAATSIGSLAKYGNSHAGWMPLCDNFNKFCNKIVGAAVLSYLGLIFYIVLTITCASKSRQTQL